MKRKVFASIVSGACTAFLVPGELCYFLLGLNLVSNDETCLEDVVKFFLGLAVWCSVPFILVYILGPESKDTIIFAGVSIFLIITVLGAVAVLSGISGAEKKGDGENV